MNGMMRFPKLGGPSQRAATSQRLGGGSPSITSTDTMALPATRTTDTGYPWADGDILYAADLNSAIAAVASSVPTGGPFLSLSGGTVTGNIVLPNANSILSAWNVGSQVQGRTVYALIDNTITFTGPQAHTDYGFLSTGSLAGTAPSGANANYIAIGSDNASMTPGAEGLSWLGVKGNVGGTQQSGNRTAIYAQLTFVGPTAGAPADRQWAASTNTFQSAANAGGTAPAFSQGGGIGYAGGDQAWLKAGATNWDGIIGREVDVAIYTGASAWRRVGLQIVSYGDLQGSVIDYGLCINALSSAPGFLYAIAVGSTTVDQTNGTILGTQPAVPGTGAGERPPKARRGIDMSQFLFSDSAFRAAGGFVVDGGGAVNVSSAKLSVTAAGQVQLDVPGQAITGVALNNGGTGYAVGDLLRGPYGTILTVSAVSGGVITGFTVNVYGGTTVASPSTTAVRFDGSNGNATFNLTFTAAGGPLSINPTGQRIGFNGTAPVAKPTGWGAATGTATRTTFATTSVTLPALAEHVKALIDDLTAYGLIGA